MELEELMANRALLKKLSGQDETPLRTFRRSPRAPHKKSLDSVESRLLTPKTETSSLSVSKLSPNLPFRNKPFACEIKSDDGVPPPPIVFVPEGYGCKIPKRLRRFTELLKSLFLLLYIFGMPVVLYQLHTNLQHTKRRIHSLNNDEFAYLIHEASYTKSRKSEIDHTATSLAIKDKLDEYVEASRLEKDTLNNLDNVKQKLVEENTRLNMIEAVGKWLKRNPNFPRDACIEGTKSDSCENIRTKKNRNMDVGSSTRITPDDISDKLVSVYTRWGKKSCPTDKNHSFLYRGFMASTSNMRGSRGVSYLCLPNLPKYIKNFDQNIRGSSYLYKSLLDVSGYHDLNSPMMKTVAPGFHEGVCSVCQVKYRNNILMIPGSIDCPTGWSPVYRGYLTGQIAGKKRTQYVCVDKNPDTKGRAIRLIPELTTLNFVEHKCRAISCMTTNYIKYAEMSCVICSK